MRQQIKTVVVYHKGTNIVLDVYPIYRDEVLHIDEDFLLVGYEEEIVDFLEGEGRFGVRVIELLDYQFIRVYDNIIEGKDLNTYIER